MKKILSLTLAVLMVVSMIPTAFAAETQDYSLGTAVTVEGAGGEYTVTVPATLSAGEVGTVTANGYRAAEEILMVNAPKTIEVTNTKTAQTATVNVSFDGIISEGNDLEEMTKTASISVDKGNTKFGTWSGTIVYNVQLVDATEGIIIFTIDGNAHQATAGMNWGDWVDSPYNTIGLKKSGAFILTQDGSYLADPTSNADVRWADSIIEQAAYVTKE